MRKFIIAMVAAVLGFLLGALVGSLCGMLWIFIFPADRITGGSEAGFDIVFGAGLAGELVGIFAGAGLALRRGARQKRQSARPNLPPSALRKSQRPATREPFCGGTSRQVVAAS